MMTRNTLSARLFRTLQKGKEQLGAEAVRRIAGFVESQRTEEDSFKDKSGKADLYYTAFGWTLSYVLGIKLNPQKMDAYLSQQDTESLDLIHYAAYMRCRMISQLMKTGKTGLLVQSLFTTKFTTKFATRFATKFVTRFAARFAARFGTRFGTKIRALDTFDSTPHQDPQSPYTRFIWLSLLEDTGHRIERNRIMDALADYQVPGGGYMNTKDGLTATTNATVAALAVKGQLAGYNIESEDLLYLRDRQEATGGFSAATASPVPDLLSTATALFTLSCYNTPPNYPARDFIEAHWLDSGGFSATILEDESDVEYTFYGLLALGGQI